ncbi:hypothetical protein BpHYR1_031266, partial [Brachionus plicatilis]
LEDGLTELELKEYIRVQIPKSVAYQTNRDYYCKLCFETTRHRAKQQLRRCDIEGCPVKYNCVTCEIKDSVSISQKADHVQHSIADEYNNENGLPDKLKNIIIELINNNPKLFPRQIRCHLNNNRVKYKIEDLELKSEQIAGFVHRYKKKTTPKHNKVDDVENLLSNNLYFPTIDPNTPFFLVSTQMTIDRLLEMDLQQTIHTSFVPL